MMTDTAIAMRGVKSSQIHSIGHDPETETLAIRFMSGSLYHYANFTAADFAKFAGAASKGSHFKAHIKPAVDRHPFTKIEGTRVLVEPRDLEALDDGERLRGCAL